MTAPIEANADALPEGLVEVGDYATEREGLQHSVVVLAKNRACWLVPADNRLRLLVEPADAAFIREQLRAFDHESVGWPPVFRTPGNVLHRLDLLSPLAWVLVILAAFWAEAAHPAWLELGALDRAAVFGRHEWWRAATALFLHADVGHLVSNALSGLFVFALVVTNLGRATGWLALLEAAVVGNAVVVSLNSDPAYRSIGASTAVFAGVGILTGRALRGLSHRPPAYRVRSMFPPLASGVTVLALYGAGGAQIDVGAHAAGFVSGLATGLLLPVPTDATSRH